MTLYDNENTHTHTLLHRHQLPSPSPFLRPNGLTKHPLALTSTEGISMLSLCISKSGPPSHVSMQMSMESGCRSRCSATHKADPPSKLPIWLVSFGEGSVKACERVSEVRRRRNRQLQHAAASKYYSTWHTQHYLALQQSMCMLVVPEALSPGCSV